MTAAKIIAELRSIDEYLGSAMPDDEPAADDERQRNRRAALVRKLKRLNGIDYEGIRAAERLREEYAREKLIAELNATAAKFMRRGEP